MNGVIVTNGFLTGDKFMEPVRMVSAAAERMGIGMRVVRNTGLAVPIGDGAAVHDVLGDADFVLFWDKDHRCARNLELCGLPVFNPSECIRVCDDKSLTHLALAGAGIPMPRTVSCPQTFEGMGYGDAGFLDDVVGTLGFPMVVKDCFGSFGQQVHLVDDMVSLRALLHDHRPRILQEYIDCGSTDIRVEVVGGEVVASVLRTGPPGDFRSNCTIGGRMHVHDATEEESELAISACGCVGADFAGVDIIATDDGPVVCEVNSNAHIRNLRDCTGIDVSDLILAHILDVVG